MHWALTLARPATTTLLLKVKVSRSAIFCFWPPLLIPCCKLVQISREMKLCRAFWPQAGSVWRVTSSPLSPIAHMSRLVTYVMCYVKNCTDSRKYLIVNLYHCGIVFNCEWDLVLLHYALIEIIRIVLSHVDDWQFIENTNQFYWYQTDDIILRHRINVRHPSAGQRMVITL